MIQNTWGLYSAGSHSGGIGGIADIAGLAHVADVASVVQPNIQTARKCT